MRVICRSYKVSAAGERTGLWYDMEKEVMVDDNVEIYGNSVHKLNENRLVLELDGHRQVELE